MALTGADALLLKPQPRSASLSHLLGGREAVVDALSVDLP
jgi:hypothetical protein